MFIVLASLAVLVIRMCAVQSEAYKAGVMRNSADYVATRHLNRNHQLWEKDFEAPEGIPGALALHLPDPKNLTGAYLRDDRDKGKPISKEMLLTQPLIAPQAGKQIRVVPLAEQTHALYWLDAGVDVRVDMGKRTAQGSVVAVTCTSSEDGKTFDSKTCAALIMLPPQEELDSTKWRLEPWTKECPKQ